MSKLGTSATHASLLGLAERIEGSAVWLCETALVAMSEGKSSRNIFLSVTEMLAASDAIRTLAERTKKSTP